MDRKIKNPSRLDRLTPGSPLDKILQPRPPSEEDLKSCSVDEIISALSRMTNSQGWQPAGGKVQRLDRIVLLVKHLLAERDYPRDQFVYECLMDAMAHPEGSAKGVRKLLREMRMMGWMQPTEKMCRSGLVALTNHTDYLLRHELEATMKSFWYEEDISVKQTIVLGLLRDEQYELAYSKLMELIADPTVWLDTWIYDIFILSFGKLGFHDEMLDILKHRIRGYDGDPLIPSLLFHVLDVCSRDFHYIGTKLAWTELVHKYLTPPPEGIIENAMGTAARHGDSELASEALDMLASRGKVRAHHYEAVMDAFVTVGGTLSAFRTLIIMLRQGFSVTSGEAWWLKDELQRDSTLLLEAEQILNDPSLECRSPTALIAPVIEALAEQFGSERAYRLYENLTVIYGESPEPSVRQAMIVYSRTSELARQLAEEYKRDIQPENDATASQQFYSKLILACCQIDDRDLAFRFAIRAVARQPDASQVDWLRKLVRLGAAHRDSRVWDVLDAFGKNAQPKVSELVREVWQDAQEDRQHASVCEAPAAVHGTAGN